jgi:FlaA1/EpsC-like NDP-sugar epimerase
MIAPQLTFLFWRGQFRGLMSYFSIPEMRRTLTALAAAFFAQVVLCYLFRSPVTAMRSIILMDLVISFFGLCGLRMAFRLLRERSGAPKAKPDLRLWRVAIIGTGQTATNLALDCGRGANTGRTAVAFFDDNPRTWHKRPHDIPVVGMPECLLNPEWRDKFDEIIVALPDATSERLEELREMLKQVPIKVSFASHARVLEPWNP